VARETEAAKRKAEQDIATALGVTLDEAKQIVADRRAADDAKKTEAERAAAAWKTAQEGAESIKRAAEQEKHDAKVERELQRAGFDITNATLLPAGMAAVAAHVQVGADEAAIKAAVEKTKTDAAQLFGTSPNPNPAPHSAPPNPNPNPQAPAGAFGQKGHESAVRDYGEDAVKKAEERWGTRLGA
jgi:sRNA-binding protein